MRAAREESGASAAGKAEGGRGRWRLAMAGVWLVGALAGCKGGAGGPDVTLLEVEAPDATDPLREKFATIAVMSECLRRRGVSPAETAQQLDAFYVAQGISLDTYAREMSRFAAEPSFQAEIERRIAKTEGCVAITGDVVGDAHADTAVADTVGPVDTVVADTAVRADAGLVADTMQAGAADTGVADTGAGDTMVDAKVVDTSVVADTHVVDASAVADTKVADTKVAEAVDAKAPSDTEIKKPIEKGVSYAGNWIGPLTGGSSGTLRVAVNGSTVTAAVATFGRASIRLKGTLSATGKLTLGGSVDKDYLRISGAADKAAKTITGTWEGVVDRKRGNGSFRISK